MELMIYLWLGASIGGRICKHLYPRKFTYFSLFAYSVSILSAVVVAYFRHPYLYQIGIFTLTHWGVLLCKTFYRMWMWRK
jgi:hypothetical protein